MFVSCILKARLDKVYFRKAVHACVISKKGNMLVNLRPFEDKIILKSQLKFLESENAKKIQNSI